MAARRSEAKEDVDRMKDSVYNETNPSGAEKTYGLLPNHEVASTPQSKVQGYLLNSNNAVGKHKARVFNSVLGYHYENWRELSNKFFAGAQRAEATVIKQTEYGVKYTVPMRIVGNKGKSMVVKTVWQYDNGSNIPRLITATFNMKSIRKEG